MLPISELRIVPKEFKSAASGDSLYQFFLSIEACFTPLPVSCTTTTTSTTTSTPTTSTSTTTTATTPTTTSTATTTPTTSTSTTSTTTSTTTTATTTTPSCAVDGLSDERFIPSFAVSGANYTASGYMIRTGGTYAMTVDISVFGCRMPITVESICLLGNIQSSYILYQTTYGGLFSPNLLSASQSATGVSDPLCFTPPPTGMMLTGVRISPQQLKSAFSSDTAFRAYITIKACFTPLNNTCLTTPTTTTTTQLQHPQQPQQLHDNVDHYHYNYSDKYKYYNSAHNNLSRR
ncbi:hypothetical protein BOX15_Mlig023086g3 [Macrostomum lignano]|uniref:Uncharacterized protein n=1 Tax=Macrostomum lignano TaxID=282301 RepID=A0A267DIP9_9PLAT|nr:hypothetical protein BOX15_Mlig023086g3 [Macrostomum lignano]